MNTLLRIAEWWSHTLWTLSWQIGVLVGIVWFVSLTCRRASPNFRYWLWCIVLLRLCVPATLSLPAGVSGDVRRVVETSAPVVLLAAQQAVETPDAMPPLADAPIPAKSLHIDAPRDTLGGRPELSLNAKLAFGWWGVVVGLLLLVLVKNVRIRRMLRSWPEVTRPDLLELVGVLRSRCSIGRAVRVRTFPEAQVSHGPAVVGIWRPTILLPKPVALDWTLDELEPVLLHELAHVKRWDLLVNLLQILVQAVYFFHPLVWFVNSRIRQERELVCDDLAVLHTGGHCKQYSQSFVRVLEETSNRAVLLETAGVGMTEHRKPLARRVIRMMGKDYRFYRPLGWVSAALLLLLSGIAIAVASERVTAPNGSAEAVSARPPDDANTATDAEQAQYLTEFAVIKVAKGIPFPGKDMVELPPGDILAKVAAKALAEAAHTSNEKPEGFEVLSCPSMTTLQGEPGSIVVGQEIPLRTSRANPTESDTTGGIQRKDVGVKASVTVAPETDTGKLGLDLRIEVSDAFTLSSVQTSAAAPATTNGIRSHSIDSHLVIEPKRGYLLKPDVSDSDGEVLFAIRVSPRPGSGHAEQPADKTKPQWPDDFESYTSGVGTWPEGWVADGNARQHDVCYVDGDTFRDTHGNTLRLHGDAPGWSPLAHGKSDATVPFQIAFDVYVESLRPDCTCVVGVRERPDWQAPGVLLFDASVPGKIKGLEPVAAGGGVSQGHTAEQLHMEGAKWYRVQLTLQEEKGRQSLAMTLDDGKTVQGPAQLSSTGILVKDMPFLQLEVRGGTAWFDNVSMTAMAVATEQGADAGKQLQREIQPEGCTRPTGHASLSGKVVETGTGAPITGAMLMLFKTDTQDGIMLRVAGDGSFEFKGIPGGAYTMRVNLAPEHVMEEGHGEWISFQLGEEEHKQDVVFTLRPGFSITGRVTAEDGSVLPEDKTRAVVAWEERPSVKDGEPPYRITGFMDDPDPKDGSYRISGLSGKPVYVQFMEMASESKDNPYPPVYFPGTFSRDKATKVTFDPNGETEIRNIDIPLRRTGGLVLEGTVSSRDDGAPIPKALIHVYHADMFGDCLTTYTDAQGHYRFECLGAGTFQLNADATPDGFVRTRKAFTLADTTPVTQLDLTLRPGATISGVFVQEDGTPWPTPALKRQGFVEVVGAPAGRMDCSGVWNRYAPGRPRYSNMVCCPGDGDYTRCTMGFPNDTSFIVSGMIPGHALINFDPYREGKKVIRINHAGKDVRLDGLQLEPGQVVEGVQIVIGAAPGATPVDRSAGALRARCADNLKQMALVFKMFVNEEKTGAYPALSGEPGQLVFSPEEKAFGQTGVYPEYLTDTRILVCPASEEAAKLDTPEVKTGMKQLINDRSYIYLGYAVTNDAAMEAFAEVYRAAIGKGSPPLTDLPVAEGTGSGGGSTLYRLCCDVDKKIAENPHCHIEVSQIPSQIPVLIERPGRHETGGGHVLYLDGSVRFVGPGDWPMTKTTEDAINRMKSLATK